MRIFAFKLSCNFKSNSKRSDRHIQSQLGTYRCVDEVQEVLLSLVVIEQRGCLRLYCNPPLTLHLKLVQYLLVPLSLCNGSCLFVIFIEKTCLRRNRSTNSRLQV